MGMRLRHNEWQRQLWKFVSNPVTEILGLVAVVLLALITLVTLEPRAGRHPQSLVIFSPR
jgi:hypothetical protein